MKYELDCGNDERKDVLAATTSTALPPTTLLGNSGPDVFFMSSVVQVLSALPACWTCPYPSCIPPPHHLIGVDAWL